jgi:hypothetical protein
VVSSTAQVTVFVLSPARCGGERAAQLAAGAIRRGKRPARLPRTRA